MFSLAVAGAPCAQAQTSTPQTRPSSDPATPDLSTPSFEELLDARIVVVSGTSRYLQNVTEAPASVTVVTAEEIERYGWRTLADVLRSVRGFYVTDDRS